MAGLNTVSPCKSLYTPRSIDSVLKGRYMQLAKAWAADADEGAALETSDGTEALSWEGACGLNAQGFRV